MSKEGKVDVRVTESSGNVFADLGLPDADDHKLKSQIVIHMNLLIQAQGLKQTEAARKMDIPQPNLSKLLRGHVRGTSIAKLLHMLNALGQDVDIRVKPSVAKKRPARTVFKPSKAIVAA